MSKSKQSSTRSTRQTHPRITVVADPIFEAIARYNAARAATVERMDNPLADGRAQDKAMGILCDKQWAAKRKLFRIVPHSVAGIRALLGCLAEHWHDELENDDADHFDTLYRTFGRIAAMAPSPP